MNPPRRKFAPPRGILSVAGDPRSFRHARYHPSTELAPFVEHYWSVEWDLRGLAPERVETLPHPSVHMIFDAREGSRIVGVMRGKFSRTLQGEGEVFAAKFIPGGFQPFMPAGVPVSTLTDRTVPLAELLGDAADAVEQEILEARGDEARIAIVERFLRERAPRADASIELVARIAYAVAADRTIVKVDDLVDRYATNKRTLQRVFSRYAGVSPKWVIQRYRLHEAAERLAADGRISQSVLALELGYSDQAHFIRDFKAMVGMSPAAYAMGARTPAASSPVTRAASAGQSVRVPVRP